MEYELNAALSIFVEEYVKEKKAEYSGNSLADFVRNEIPKIISKIIQNDDRYSIQGSVGQGNWAKVPWVGIFDKFVTETAQKGFYVVYLVCEDYSGIYLSLNQGVTSIKEIYGSDATHALKVRAQDYSAQLGSIIDNFEIGEIDLKVTSKTSLGALYQAGSICSKYYSSKSIPNDSELITDLHYILDLYLILSSKSLIVNSSLSLEDDEYFIEDLTKLKEHKRIERNQALAKKVKKIHGYKCQACGFSFKDKYMNVGDEYIEAHHLVPLTEIQDKKISLNPRLDFAVLCSNCHRMIHKTAYVSDINEFIKNILKEV